MFSAKYSGNALFFSLWIWGLFYKNELLLFSLGLALLPNLTARPGYPPLDTQIFPSDSVLQVVWHLSQKTGMFEQAIIEEKL